jgi:alpha-tubulin suppressor-like RCC1 family protein
MAGLKSGATDLDALLHPLQGTKRADVGIRIGANDISNLYEPVASGSAAAATGFRSAATDVGSLFAAFGSVGRLAFGWGDNNQGQLALGNFVTLSSPVQIGANRIRDISVGNRHILFLDGFSRMWGVGSNLFGQIGVTQYSTPQSWTQISTTTDGGGDFTAGIRSDGLLFTWGANIYGALAQGPTGLQNTDGGGTRVFRNSPVQVGTNSWSRVSVGRSVAAAIRSDGLLFTWGAMAISGTGSFFESSSPVQVGTNTWTDVSAGGFVCLAIRTGGTLWSWGANSAGQLGLGNTINRSSPVQVGTSTWNDVQIDQGMQFSATVLGRRSDNLLFAWGSNQNGRLGIGNTINRSSPVQVGTSTWTKIAPGSEAMGAIRSDSLLFTWGAGSFTGALGQNNLINRSSPVQLGALTWSDVATSSFTMGAIRGGTLFTWGQNGSGQLGLNDTITRSSPVQVGALTTWSQIFGRGSGEGKFFVRTNTSAIFVFGVDRNGSLGLGNGATPNVSSPVQLGSTGGQSSGLITNFASPVQIGSTHSWTQVSAGDGMSAAIRKDGLLFVWGAGSQGGLGLGNIINRSAPVQLGTSTYARVDCSKFLQTTRAIRSDNLLFTFGANFNGQLGLNDAISRSSPVQVGTSTWNQISTGAHSLARRSDNLLFVWGSGLNGQLGLGVAQDRSAPVQLGASTWSQVNAHISVSGAVRSDNLLFTWGVGGTGRIGDNTTQNKSSPVQIGALTWSRASCTASATYGLRATGALFAWGVNGAGVLGLNSVSPTNFSSPVQVGASNFTEISSGGPNFGSAANVVVLN